MQVWSILGVAGLALAQSCAAAFPSSSSSSSVTSQAVIPTAAAAFPASTQDATTATTVVTTASSSENAATTSASTSSTAVIVATDASGQFTAIGDAISYAQSKGIPTVTVKAGTYTQAVTVSATATVVVIGEASSQQDYSQNQVTISATSPLTISSNVLGITFRNINFVNTATGSYAAATIRGSKNAFYGCQFVSAGSLGINANLGLAIIADSYIEALDKIIYGYPGLYVYNTTIVPVDNSALIVYNRGTTYNSVLYNSTVVFDSCSVQQKSGTSTKNVYLGAANNGYGSVVVYRDSTLGSLITATGAYTDSYSTDPRNFYGEFENTGTGSYANNEAKRSAYVHLLSATDLTRFSPAEVFASAYYQFAATNTDWVDADVLAAIESADVIQQSTSTSTTVTTAASSISAASTSASQVTATRAASTLIRSGATGTTTVSPAAVRVSASSSAVSSATASSSTGCSLPSTVPTSALVVGPSGSCAQYTSIASAVAALPSDSTTQYVYILSGTYEEAITISREGATVFRGQTTNALDQSSNTVTIVHSAGVLSSNGGSASTATFQASQYYAKGISFYNINFENDYTPAKNNIAVAVAAKAQVLGFYGCGIKSSQGSLLINYGAFYFSDCRIEGTTDFIWGYGGIYVYNSRIISDGTTTGQTIAAQSYQTSYGPSQFVFDSCAFVPSDSSVPKSSTYLGRDYSTKAHVAVLNSYLDAHIAPLGWLISSSSSSVTFAEYNNTGPGASTSSRSSVVDILSDDSAYSIANVLGSTSWIDTSAIASFSGFPDSVYGTSVSSSASVSVTATASASVVASATSAAPTSTSTFVVSQNATTGQYRNVTAAIAALPSDGKAYTIYILAGTYTEQISITRSGKVTLRGETSFANDYTQNLVTIEFSNGELTSAGKDESTPVINAKKTDGTGLALYNINFQNTYPQTSNTAALAADFYGTNMAAYGCSFIGFQDTLLANKGTQVFSNCYIEGSIDYIWGYSTAYFHQCYIATNTPGACIAAQSRSSSTASGGYVFDTCYVTYTSTYGSTYGKSYLGRPYSEYSIAVYMNSYLDKHINAAGWEQWSTSSPNTAYVTFGEYNNSGPGAWSSSRVSFATNLTATQAASYSLSSWVGDTTWLDMTAYNYVPSYSLTGPSTTTSTNTSTSTATATWAHPTSGTVPPAGAVLVSPDGAVNGSYSSLTDALASLPDDSSTQIIFMYAGSYNEQVPSVDRDGPVMIIGYQSGSPGATYTNNQVTITYSRGLSVSPLPTGHSDAETATFATASNQIALYNINIINTANLDGSQSSYVTLAGSIYGSEIGFYGCSLVGWQDTLLTGSTTGYQYYESSYIEGAIDFIWGYSKAYFKGCTIGAKRQKSAITAQSRASSTAVGGYIFDQCLFDAASDATVDLTELVYLGRPYSEYALVVVKNSYLTDIINPSGWKVWSTTDPRTDYVTFAEYNNSGPGNWENNAASREAFEYCTLLTSDTYTLAEVMGSTDWIDMTYWNSIVTPEPASTTTTTTGSNSTTVYDGTTPPAGAYIVSKTAIANVTTYDTIQSALNALPTSSKVTPTVFIYPGTYEEQLVVNRSGTTIFMGYSDNHLDYSSNQVTIQYNHGVDTQADESNSDSATVYATGNYFQAVNINFVNNYGTTKNYASLGFAVKSSKYASLYGCQVTGNQDALLINGYFFASNSYIEGNIDMIWGSGSGYFLNSTISPNEDGINLTADKRTTSTTVGGFVFDQCTITPASGAGSMSEISLGRPWNNYARVAYVESYLDSCVEAAGWEQWSSSSPQTDGVLFGEYQNYGPGSSTADRASFATVLDASTVAQFELTNFFASTSWINFTLVDGTPFVPGNSTTLPVTSTGVIPSTSVLATATPTATFTTLVTVTDKETAFTTLTPADRTSTVKVTVTQDIGTTVTLAESFKTTVEKTTISSTTTIVEPTVTSIKSTVITSSDIETITAPASTKTTTVKDTTTITATVTEGDVTTTVKSTVTATSTITSSAKAKTITETLASTTTSVKTSTPGTVKVTSYTTVTEGSGGTTTKSTKATTTTVDVTSTKTTTKSVTTTLSCIPAANAKRALILPRAAVNAATVTQYTTLTTYVKTSTDALASPTVYVTSTTIKTTGKTTTLKASTSTITSVSLTTKVTTETVKAVTVILTESSTKVVAKTTTLKASTVTDTITSAATKTSTVSVPGATVTVTSLKTTTFKSTVTLPQSTITKTKATVTTIKETVTLATPTTTVLKTTTVSLEPSVTVTQRATSTRTSTISQTVTETETVTKTSKSAKACPTD